MHLVRPISRLVGATALIALVLTLLPADASAQALSPDVAKAFKFRAIGPTRQSGRFVDFAVPALEPNTIYAATGSGGLWKSVNNGISWEPIFDNQPVISIGDIAVAATDPKIVWVGTGEHTSSRSTYWGDGVYKSTDAGKTWTNVGLKDSHHIGRIVIDPKNPNIVYVAALGHLYSAERRARRLQDDRRRQDLDQVARGQGRRPNGRRGGPRDGSEEPEDPLRGRLRQGAPALDVQPRRPRQRHLQDRRRRQDLDEAHRRPAGRHARAHRPRRLREEPAHPLREHREREQDRHVRRRPPQGAARGQVERRP